ncbi:hypothetical protein NCER_100864 [Vairimorpha ceranae BRL01]|uniref:GOLD domain-containing protein n=1 Tax=Vairimorpha ceranae (strain BRL01) TaxID=578460 RepID=C4V8N2_VAIC1|nr:hypothetical protein NCER_100864 [Vairimorpha ceranae BRL01]
MFMLNFFSKIFCEIFLFDIHKRKQEIIFDVTGNQICTGWFNILPNSNADFSVVITANDGSKFFSGKVIKKGKKDFSFNVTDTKDIKCTMTANFFENNKSKTAELEIKFDTQFDTFRKDVAKQVRIEPATYSLTKIGNVMMDMNNYIDKLITKLSRVDVESKKTFIFSILLSMVVLIVYVIVEIYLLNQMKTFFKTKKLI